jgi:hypothetical protein
MEVDDILAELILGENVETIGVAAFSHCTGLEHVISLNPEAPNVADLNGNGSKASDMTLHISASAKDAYAETWAPHFNDVVYHELRFNEDTPELVEFDLRFKDTYAVSYTTTVAYEADGTPVYGARDEEHGERSYLTWATTDENVATVVDGVITPVWNGDCVITATSIFGDVQQVNVKVFGGVHQTTTGIETIETASDSTDYRAYTPAGVEVLARPLEPGMYILVFGDGSVKKVVKK